LVTKAAATVKDSLKPIAGKYTIVWLFDADVQSWLFYAPEIEAQSTMTRLEKGKGYLIKANEDTSFTYGGNTYTLKKGWNSIGWLG
jgi:hypothetical protein